MKAIVLLTLVFLSAQAFSQDVHQFRGNDRSGIYHETGLLEEWPPNGPPLLWHFDGLGKGFSSVIVHSDKLFVTGMVDSTGYLTCLNTRGKLIWIKKYGLEWHINYPGARSTPTYDDGRLYLMSSPGVAICIDAEDGSLIWKRDMAESFGARQLRFGMAESPLVVGDRVIYTPGGTSGTIVALEKTTGEDSWVAKISGQQSAYCSPLLINHNGNELIITSIETKVVAIRPRDGELVWSYPQINSRSTHPNTPVYDGENIYSFTGYGKGGIMLKLSDDGSSVTLGWENTTLDPQIGGIVLVDGYIYGSGHNYRQWQCLDARTGEKKYELTDLINGAVIYNDGLLYCYSDKTGTVSILRPGENAFEIKGSFTVELGTEQHWAHPVISNGILYIRHGNALMAYNLKR